MFHSLEQLVLHRRITAVRALFVNTALRTASVSLFGIFEPIYIFEITKTISPLLIYYLIIRLGSVFAVVFVGRLVTNLGFRRSVLVSSLTLCVHLSLLMMGKNNLNLIFLAAVFAVPAILFYWLPTHILMIDESSGKNLGRQVSTLEMIGKAFHILPPFIGGALIAFGGFSTLYSFSIVLALLSSLPLFFMPSHHQPRSLEYLKFARAHYFPKLSFFWNGFEDFFLTAIWPVFIFLIIRSFAQIGLIASLVLLATTVVLFFVGYLSDHGKALGFYRLGSLGSALIFPLRIFISTPLNALVLDSFHNIVRVFQAVPFSYLTYRNSPRGYEYEYVVFREILLDLGRAAAAFSVFLLLSLSDPWRYLFILPALANLLIFFSSGEFRSVGKVSTFEAEPRL